MPLHRPHIRIVLLTVLAWTMACGLIRHAEAEASGRLVRPGFSGDYDLSGAARLFKSDRYRMEVRRHGDRRYTGLLVFETRNDWTLYDYFNKDPARRNDVLSPAGETGLPSRLRSALGTGKADLRTASFSRVSFSGTALDVRVTLLRKDEVARSVTVRPLRFGIPVRITGGGRSIEFTIPAPRKLSIEINGRLDPIFLFGDAPDVADLKATYYFGPGLHRIPGSGTLTLQSHERVFIADGAIVEGRFLLAPGSTDITIRGRGIVSGGPWPDMRVAGDQYNIDHAAIWTDGSARFLLEGITFVQSTNWQIAINDLSADGRATHDNRYLNFNTVSWNGCTDGIWITGDRNRVDNAFIFNNDDFFVTKGGRDTKVTNVVAWGGAWGRMILFQNIMPNIAPVDRLTFENIDVIGKEGAVRFFYLEGRGPGSKYARVAKPMSNVTFRNVVFEERRRMPNSNTTGYNAGRLFDFDAVAVPGSITNLRFENLSLDQILPSEGWILGSRTSPVSGLTFKNVTVRGRKVLDFRDLHIRTNEFVDRVDLLP